MRSRSKIFLAATVLLVAGCIAGAVTAPHARAQASGTQICTSQKCLNLWNGGPNVKAYSPNVFNDNFVPQFVNGRCAPGSSLTTQNCPVTGMPGGYRIVQLRETSVDHGTFDCVGDQGGLQNQADATAFDLCNNTNTGSGGDWGTLFVEVPDSCTNAFDLMNVHWSPSFSGSRYLLATPQTNGSQYFLNVATATCYNVSTIP